MAVHHITVTLGTAAAAISATSTNVQELQIESETGNAAVYVGGSTVSSTDYGRTVSAGPSAAVTIRGTNAFPINLNSTYLFGTNAQKVHILYTV